MKKLTKARSGAFIEEYEKCGCSFAAREVVDLPGYCEKHGNDRKTITFVRNTPDQSLGFVSSE